MDNFELCEGVCALHENIMGAAVLQQGVAIAGFSKPVTPLPNEERLKAIFFQTEIIAAIHRSNQDFYGPLLFFTVHFEGSDVLAFPLENHVGEKTILAFKISPPYNHDELVAKVLDYIKKRVSYEGDDNLLNPR